MDKKDIGGRNFTFNLRSQDFTQPGLGFFSTLLLLVLHNFFLWIVAPFGFVVWLLMLPWLGRYSRSLSKFMGWLDWNFIVALVRGPLRPFTGEYTLDWVPLSQVSLTTHRMSFSDFS